MTKVDPKIRLDRDVLRRVDDEAKAKGASRDEIIEESLRRSFAARQLRSVLERVRQRSTLTEDEAIGIADEERRAARSARRR